VQQRRTVSLPRCVVAMGHPVCAPAGGVGGMGEGQLQLHHSSTFNCTPSC
jgi:hypothetical protein